MLVRIIPAILLFCFISFIGSTQEYLIDVGNIRLQQYSAKYWDINNRNQAFPKTSAIELPFFDDFASSYIYPDSTKWEDKYAFIGYNYAIDPISINTATLDAINEFGLIYPHLPYNNPEIADYLTSKPINLNYSPEDSIYLSFFYQAGGYGNTPEFQDSLVLEFKTPEVDNWTSVWRMPGGENMDYFQVVMIPIVDSIWLTNDFQFRFKNYVSLGSLYEPSWVSNVDHWHLDFIYLDKNRSIADSIPNDVAMIKNVSSFIKNFESVPWKHFIIDDNSDMISDSLTFVYKNSGDEVLNINRQFRFTDLMGSFPEYAMLDDSENIDPYETLIYTRPHDFLFESDSEDSARFEVKVFFNSGTDDPQRLRYNDTIRYYQNFYNYYAYDDGTAEKGYGLAGQGTAYSQLALRFEPLVADSLQGVYMYFNHTLNEANQNFFFLTVWAENDSLPGDTLYQEIGVLPEFSDEINGFVYYPLDTAIYVEGPIYVGWVKTTDDMLNIGFDVNRVANQHLFFNVTGEWQQSTLEGAVMIRPVFGSDPYPFSRTENHIVESDFEMFPNPANDYVTFKTNGSADYIDIYNSEGRLVLSKTYKDRINISSLNQGMYFIRLKSNTEMYKTKRLIIIK